MRLHQDRRQFRHVRRIENFVIGKVGVQNPPLRVKLHFFEERETKSLRHRAFDLPFGQFRVNRHAAVNGSHKLRDAHFARLDIHFDFRKRGRKRRRTRLRHVRRHRFQLPPLLILGIRGDLLE